MPWCGTPVVPPPPPSPLLYLRPAHTHTHTHTIAVMSYPRLTNLPCHPPPRPSTGITSTNDYSFFDLDVINKSNSWAGARHWKYGTYTTHTHLQIPFVCCAIVVQKLQNTVQYHPQEIPRIYDVCLFACLPPHPLPQAPVEPLQQWPLHSHSYPRLPKRTTTTTTTMRRTKRARTSTRKGRRKQQRRKSRRRN